MSHGSTIADTENIRAMSIPPVSGQRQGGQAVRVGVIGKGGAGKSTVAGTLARLLARRGHQVLILDLDTMPGVAATLGAPAAERRAFWPLTVPDEASPMGHRLTDRVDLDAFVREHASVGRDGVRLLPLGKVTSLPRDERFVASLVGCWRVLPKLADALPGWTVIGDHPAGTRWSRAGWASYAQAYLTVVQPSVTSLLTADRLGRLGDEHGPVVAVANGLRDPADRRLVERHLPGIPLVAGIPYDEAVQEADRAGRPLLDHAPSCSAVRELDRLAERIHRHGVVGLRPVEEVTT